MKSRIHMKQKSNIVYEIPCKDCSKTYIGQTSRSMNSRIISHRSDCKRNINSCALSEHVNRNDHRIDYDNSRILDSEKNLMKRVFLEMVHINSNSNSMNKRTDLNNLSQIYTYLLEGTSQNYQNFPT